MRTDKQHLSNFDRTVVLNVDKRLNLKNYLEKHLITLKAKDLKFFTVGDGKILPKEQYDRINEEPSEDWKNGSFANLKNSYNAFLSYQDIVRQAKLDGIKSLALFEDDIVFLSEYFGSILDHSLAVLEMMFEWDVLYLSANHTWGKTKEIARNVLKVDGCVCWHSIVLKNTVFDEILSWKPDRPIDDKAKELHKKYNCYALWPNLIWQSPGFSNVENKYVDYTHYINNKGLCSNG